MARLQFCDYHNMVVILEKSEHNVDFHPIVDFVEASPLRYALTVKPTVYVSHIRQFWSTARIETTKEETKILSTVDGILKTVTESSLRKNLKLQDDEGISRIVPLFDTMLVPQGEGSGTPTEPHHTPSSKAHHTSYTTHSSPTLPPVTTAPIPTVTPSDTLLLRQYTRRTRIAQSSALPPVADEPASPLRDVSEAPRVTSPAAGEGRVAIERSGDDAPIKGRNLDKGESAAERVSDDTKEMATVLTSMDAATVLASGVAKVPTGSGSIPTAGLTAIEVPTSSDVVPTTGPIFATATMVTPYSRRKSKETMVESKTPKKKKIQEQMDIQMARKLEKEMERDAQRMNEQIARDAEIARIHAEEELQIMIDRSNETLEDFIPIGSKEEAERFKRKGIRFKQESMKKLKTLEKVPKEAKIHDEVPKEKVKEMMQLVPIEEHLDREDLNQLWALVKESLSNRPPTSDKEMELWRYDTCGVHHVTAKDKEIFMLVKKDYPFRKGLAIGMISYKLQVENYSKMANDLILKIYKIAISPRQQVIEFLLLEAVPTASEESCHCQKKREATAVKIALLLKSRRNCQSKSNDSYAKHYKELSDSIKTTRAKTIEHTTSLIAQNAKFKAQLHEKGFPIAALKNKLRKLTGYSVNTKFAKSSILGKPVLQPHRNQSVIRQPTAFNSGRPRISKPRFIFQVDHNIDLSKPVTTHYLPKGKESACAKPHHMIAPGTSRYKRQCCSLILTEFDSLPNAHAQTTKTYNKHQDSRIKKAQVLKTKTFTNYDIQDLPLRCQVYHKRLLASFQEDAKYEHLFTSFKAYNEGNVIFGSNLRGNIIDKGKICDNKCRTFSEHNHEITKDGKVIGKGIRKKCLYVMKLGNRTKDQICLAMVDENFTLWHRRLGHANMHLIQSLTSKELVRNLPKLKFDQHFCNAYKIGKQAHASHKAKNIVSMTRCLELLHIDLFGPSVIRSYRGNRYTLVIVDDYSRYIWTKFLKDKTKAFNQFEIFNKKIQSHLGCTIVSIKTDHGREFDNDVKFGEFCNANGITHNFLAPHTPQSNGVVGRKYRTLQEMSRTMLNEQSLPKKFWCNAVDTSTYILNRILIRAMLGRTPYELLKGRKPTLDYFIVFGSKCFILNTKYYLTKFDPKSYEGIFLGYSQNSKAYIILNKHTKKVKESLNVKFNETSPPSKTTPLVDDDLDEEKELRNMKIIGTKWMFRNKLDENGIVSRNKARLVAQCYKQQVGIDYNKTYAPVARHELIRILLAYACALDFKLFQMDVKSAFLKGFINEDVYVAQPPGFIDFEKLNHVYKLKKALYGLKQAPKACSNLTIIWQNEWSGSLNKRVNEGERLERIVAREEFDTPILLPLPLINHLLPILTMMMGMTKEPRKIKLTLIPPKQLFVDLTNDDDNITTPSPTTTSSSLIPTNAPSKTSSTNQTSSSQENASSSFQSKLQISSPSSNEPTSPRHLNPLLDNILDVPPRPINPQPL
nr:retrotransposon protein [Tanacetum cinerariifolium]